MTARLGLGIGSGTRRTGRALWVDAVLLVVLLLGLTVFLLGLSVSFPAAGHAEGLDCPQTGPGVNPAIIAGDSQIRRMTTANDVDLGNEIAVLIARAKATNPALSNDAIIDSLIAAYCPVVAQMTGTSSAEKWRLMRQFAGALMQQVAAGAARQGTLIIASVPLSPAVYQALSKQASSVGKTAADLMAAILTRAAGQ